MWAALLVLCALPAPAQSAESVPVAARLKVEHAVGASLALDISDDLIVQVYLPGWPVLVRSRRMAMPGMLLSFEDTEVVADSTVSLRIEHRAAATTSSDAGGEEADGGALLILAQFN